MSSGEACGGAGRAGGGVGHGALAVEGLCRVEASSVARDLASSVARDLASSVARDLASSRRRCGPTSGCGVPAREGGRRWPTSGGGGRCREAVSVLGRRRPTAGATSSVGRRESTSDAASSLGSCGATLGGGVHAQEVPEAVAGGGRWRTAAGSGGRWRERCGCSGGGVRRHTREMKKWGYLGGAGGGLGAARGRLQCSAGMDSPRPRCEARFQLLTRAWLRDRFRRRWAWLEGHMQANKHLKVGWTENL
jgi:hypothetical protein